MSEVEETGGQETKSEKLVALKVVTIIWNNNEKEIIPNIKYLSYDGSRGGYLGFDSSPGFVNLHGEEGSPVQIIRKDTFKRLIFSEEQ